MSAGCSAASAAGGGGGGASATPARVATPYVQPELSADVMALMEGLRERREAVTFDEMTLEDQESDVHPNGVSTDTHVTRLVTARGIVLSAAMDTVTERAMALTMARIGCVGVLHRNMSVDEQVKALNWVRFKVHYGGMIDAPRCFAPTDRLSDLQAEVRKQGYTFTSFPIVERDTGRLLGLMTRDELDFIEADANPTLADVMKPRAGIVSARVGTTSAQAYELMTKHKVKKLPVVADEDRLVGMYVWGDVRADTRLRDRFALDDEGHFLVAAAVGCAGEADERRAEALIAAGCRIIVIDSSHGACGPAKQLLHIIKRRHGDRVQVIVGNVASYRSAKYLITNDDIADADSVRLLPDAIKVGIGPGSICTTRQVSGTGVPQMTAIYSVYRALRDAGVTDVPVIADGGIRTSGDVVKALSVGAAAVMLGSVLAGTDESPGRTVQRGNKLYRVYRGMGSHAAMTERSGSRARYNALDSTQPTERLTAKQGEKVVAEGVEGLVEAKGPVENVVAQLHGGVACGLAHTGARTIDDFQRTAALWRQSQAGVVEGRPHTVIDPSK